MRRVGLVGVLIGLGLLMSGASGAPVSREEFDALKSEVRVLREAVKMQSDILKRFLERAGMLRETREPPFKEAIVGGAGGGVYGRADAKVTIVEFSDYQCPFCARHARETFPQLDREYIQTGRLKYVFRDYPVEAAHPQAFKAHEAVHCAAEQGKRHEMHVKIFANQRALGSGDLVRYANELALDKAAFDRCLSSGAYAAKINDGIGEGERLGVRGTPTFFVGLTEPGSANVKAVRRIIGAQPYSAFKAAIEEVLASK
jgi:protein-disulfide isomerase